MRALVTAELTKIRSVRSTFWTLAATLVASVGLSYLIGRSWRSAYPDFDAERQAKFDPVLGGFYGLILAQLALVVFAVLAVTAEYSSGTIRASLAAIPERGRFYAAKLAATLSVAVPFSAVTVLATFFTAQSALGPYGKGLFEDEAPRAVVGACLYLTLMCALSAGVAMLLRSTALTLGIIIPLLFLGSQGLFSIPGIRKATQYLPDQAGYALMQTTPPEDSMFGARDFGPWVALAVLLTWTAAAVLGGYATLRHRDA